MIGSKLHPKTFRGAEVSEGVISKNKNPTKTTSPDWFGNYFEPGIGWIKVSGWEHQGPFGAWVKLKFRPMTDEEVERRWQKNPWHEKPNGQHRRVENTKVDAPTGDDGQSDIPF